MVARSANKISTALARAYTRENKAKPNPFSFALVWLLSNFS